jgi:hypothetical protein
MRPQNRKGNKKSPMFPFPFPRITLNLYMQLPDIFMGGLAIGDRHGVGVVGVGVAVVTDCWKDTRNNAFEPIF